MSTFALNLFGSFEVKLGGESVKDLRSSRAQALLIYLAVERTRAQRREALFTLLWPGMPEKSARHNLSQAIYALRQVFPEEEGFPWLLADRQTVQLNPNAQIVVDVQQMEGLLAKVKTHAHPKLEECQSCITALEQSTALYRGEFLADFYLGDSSQFEDWAQANRETYRRKALETLETLATIFMGQKAYDRAQHYAQRQLEIDNLQESAYRQLMEILTRNGRRAEAMRQYHTCAQILADELGTAPSQKTADLFERIQTEDLTHDQPFRTVQSNHIEIRENAKGITTLSAIPTEPPHNLHLPPTLLVGRESELDDLDCYIADPQIRLITIVAPGGMGKTRLALACAKRQLKIIEQFFPDGIFFIPFSQLEDPDRIVDTIAEAIRFQVDNDLIDTHTPKAQLLDHLREKRMFLLIDNFEHLQSKATLLTDILQVSSGVQILVTARERLNLHAEQVYPIGGLSVENENLSGQTVESPAAQLFIQSASRIKPGFLPGDEEDVSNLMQICRLVDGMPLALELAAGWVDLLSLPEIAAEIQRDLDFLATEYHDVPSRHRGIRAVFDSTWRQLSKTEQDALARFSVFRNGCTKDAAQVVMSVSLKTLTRLAKKSLLHYEKSSGRYQIHPLLLQFAAEKLSQIPEMENQTREAHSVYYCMALEKWDKALKSPQHAIALSETRADYENIHLAWDWALTHGKLSNLWMAVDGLREYYEVDRRLYQSQRMFGVTIKRLREDYGHIPTSPEALRLLALALARQEIVGQRYLYAKTEKVLLESLDLLTDTVLKEVDTRHEEAFIRLRLGMALIYSAHGVRVKEARSHLEISLQLYRELNNQVGIGEALNVLIDCAIYLGNNNDQIEPMISESLAIHRQIGDPRRLAKTLMTASGIARYHLLAYDKAFDHLKEAYAISKRGEELVGMADAQEQIGFLSWYLGEFDAALEAFEEAFVLAQRAGSRYEATIEHVNIGLTQAYRGQFAQAEVLIREGMKIDQLVDHHTQIVLLFVLIHLGHSEEVRRGARKIIESDFDRGRPWALRLLSWDALARNSNIEALAYGQRSVDAIESVFIPTQERKAWSQVPLGLAFHRQGQIVKAKSTLYEALQTCVKIRAFLPMMHLLPVITVVLAEEDDNHSKEMAVELYTAARQIPFIENSQLFKTISEPYIQEAARQLPQEDLQAAEARGELLKSREIAETLLKGLEMFGWNKMSDAL